MQDFNHSNYLKSKPVKKPRTLKKIVVIAIGLGLALLIIWQIIKSQNQVFISPQIYEFSAPDKTPQAKDQTNESAYSFDSTDEVVTAIDGLVINKQGTYGWYAQSLLDGETYGQNFDFAYTAASINKVPIMVSFLEEVEAGRLDLSDIYRLKGQDKEGGTGFLQNQKNGTPYTYEELLLAMGKQSDNTATNVIAKVTGRPKIQEFLDSRNMNQTDINKNTTSPKNMSEMFSNIYLDNLFQKKSSKQLLFKALSKTKFEDRISKGVPADILVVHKIGNQIQVWSDCGLVLGQNPYSLCVLTDQIKQSEAEEILPQISKIIWDYESNRGKF